jgi:hypothetical protein
MQDFSTEIATFFFSNIAKIFGITAKQENFIKIK